MGLVGVAAIPDTGGVNGGPETETAVGAGISRRRLLQSAALAAGALYVPAFRLTAADAQAGCPVPPGFPAGIDLYRQAYENWARSVVVDDAWTCAPASGSEVARLANWARRRGYRLRPKGAAHGWSPFTFPKDPGCDDRIVLLDTSRLDRLELDHANPTRVRVGSGVSMESLLTFAEGHGLGLASVPAIGAPTVGGVLAIGAHGAAFPAVGEARQRGSTYGSVANLVVSLRVVIWSRRRGRYVVRTIDRKDPRIKAMLVGLGRVFVVDARLQLAPNQNLRCRSYTDIPATELFSPPGSGGRTFASFLDETGRAESIWFPFTENPWHKTWAVSPEKPAASRAVTGPYNYPFSDNLPTALSDLLDLMLDGNPEATPLFGQGQYQAVSAGLDATDSRDIWGPAKNTQLYIKASTLRVDDCGYAIVTRRDRVQRVLSDFAAFYGDLLAAYQSRGEYPINGPLQLRVSGIDNPRHVAVRGARAPVLSPSAPLRERGWNAIVWINVLTIPDTPGSYAFYRDVERFIFRTFRGGYALVRPEWSKGWAYGRNTDFADKQVLESRIPRSFRRGRPAHGDWDWACRQLRRLDPHGVFSNDFLDALL